jgi:hypothetical protein
MGKITDKLHKHQGFFGFGLGKLEIEFLKNNDPLGIFSPKDLTCQNMIHGVRVWDNRGSA